MNNQTYFMVDLQIMNISPFNSYKRSAYCIYGNKKTLLFLSSKRKE